jgi:hypothetical protein
LILKVKLSLSSKREPVEPRFCWSKTIKKRARCLILSNEKGYRQLTKMFSK